MSSLPNIDLFAFPQVIISRILQTFDHNTFFKFSLCSSKSLQLAKSESFYRKVIDFDVEFNTCRVAVTLRFKNETKFLIDGTIGRYYAPEEAEEYTVGGLTFPSILQDSQQIRSYWDGLFDTFKLVNYVIDLFKKEPTLMSVVDVEDYEPSLSIKTIARNYPKVPKFSYECAYIPDDDYHFLMQTLQSSHLKITQCNPGCEVLNLNMSQSNIKYFYSRHAQWLNFHHLVDWDLIELRAFECKITSEEFNSLLRMWKRGLKRNMRRLKISLQYGYEMDRKLMMKGLGEVSKPENDIRKYKGWIIQGGYEIHGDDGSIARISTINRTFTAYFWPVEEKFSDFSQSDMEFEDPSSY